MLAACCLSTALSAPAGLQSAQEDQLRREEAEDYFEKWLKEDVLYIITPEERAVFEALTTTEEKEQFIEQFWRRRDPDPRTSVNEFKEEHYRRIAYANDNFTAGWDGWRTDRGKIYIIHGPPNEIESYPSGGNYERPLHEGGGTTSVYPFELWRYRHIDNVGTNVELQFVDRSFSGLYDLALSPEEKDAFMRVPNAGFTMAEELGFARREQRPYFRPGGSYPMMNYREQDRPFIRYERLVAVQRPPEIKHAELKQVVDTDISYTNLPFELKLHQFRLNDERILATVSVKIDNKELTFVKGQGVQHARVALYGVVTDISGKIAAEFEDELAATFKSVSLEDGRLQQSLYQKTVVLDSQGRKKINVVAKDLNSDKLGVVSRALVPRQHPEHELSTSSLVLSDFIVPVTDPFEEEMFVLGDVKVRPSLTRSFTPNNYFGVYLQIYNVAVDQSRQAPFFHIAYRISRQGKTLLEFQDQSGESVQYFSPQRMVLIKRIPLESLPPGKYSVEVEFSDLIRDQKVTASEQFQITAPAQMVSR